MSEPAERLAEAHAAYERTREAVEAFGEPELRRLAGTRRELMELFERYEDRATGTGDFGGFIEFQSQVSALAEELPDDLPRREAFEAVDDAFDKRRLNGSDFERARKALEPVRETTERLDERERARERYRDTRRDVRSRIEELDDRIEELEALLAFDDVDLDAPTERLRGPIEAYNERVTAAFEAFLDRSSAREVCAFFETADRYPLVDTEPLPADFAEYVTEHRAGGEPIPLLLEYASYSRSKLEHYVDDADALKRAVATRRTVLAGIDAEPFRIERSPPSAAELRWRIRELRPLVDRFASGDEFEGTITRLHDLRSLTRGSDYAELRRTVTAHETLTDRQRERLANGEIAAEREAAIEERGCLREALERYVDAETMASS